MPTLTNPHVLARPVRHRIPLLETAEDLEYLAASCNVRPDIDGTWQMHDYSEPVQVLGSYLVEELNADGAPSGVVELMTWQKFNGRYEEIGDPALEYGVCGQGVRSFGGMVEKSKDITAARVGALYFKHRMPEGTFQVVSRPAGSYGDWTAVGP